MELINLKQLSLPLVLGIFAVSAGVVWFAGTRLSRYADALAKKTGTADVLIGTLLLGGITSLPEVVTTVTASMSGDAAIAVNNLFGGVALQVTVLVIGDFMLRKRSITSLIESPVVQMQAIVGIILLLTAAAVIVLGEHGLANIGAGTLVILVFFVGGFYFINYLQSIHWWKSDPEERDTFVKVKEITARQIEEEERRKEVHEKKKEEERRESFSSILKTHLFLYLLLSAAAILIGGYVVVVAGQSISEKTGIGSSVVGAILVALATSLPEVSTTVSSIRIQEYRLAFSNIFGTNIFDVGILFIADITYTKGPILNEVGNFAVFGALMGSLLTGFYLIGLLMRFKKTFLNLGFDSVLVLLGYLAGATFMVTVLKGGS